MQSPAVDTAWVQSVYASGGRDHLGTQAPCMSLYAQLVPGINNVTDRARYYAFYPWLFWSLDQRSGGELTYDEYVDTLRRADCLFTLIGLAHEQEEGQSGPVTDHSAALVGSDTLSDKVSKLRDGGSLSLSVYAQLRDGPNRYFQNKLGGLGQYYKGTLQNLGVLDDDSNSVVKCTSDRGATLAKAFDQGVDGDRFFAILDRDEVDYRELCTLSSFCPCGIPDNTPEQKELADVFFGTSKASRSSRRRRATLGLILDLVRTSGPSDRDLDGSQLRRRFYTQTTMSGADWRPERFTEHLHDWRTYIRNDLFSVALQGIFWSLVVILDSSDRRFSSTIRFVEHLSQSNQLSKVRSKLHNQTVSEFLDEVKEKLPPIRDGKDPQHEQHIAFSISRLTSDSESPESDIPTVLGMALHLLASLAIRSQNNADPYDSFSHRSGYFDHYPLNLRTFRRHLDETWSDMSAWKWFEWLARNWSIDAHLRVALRKLQQQTKSTFVVQPGERGLQVREEIPEPVFTTPRLNQTIQMLRDIGCFSVRDEQLILSEFGIKRLSEINKAAEHDV